MFDLQGVPPVRGAAVAVPLARDRRAPSGKTRITIRIDEDILQWFRDQVHKAGGGSYQTLINDTLRSAVDSAARNPEDTLRRVLREELAHYRATAKTPPARR